MKIAVYTIALNEEKHVKRWFESAKEADLLLIADTGSTDNTRFVAKALGIEVQQISVEPWRFDVARNASLALIPSDFDMCIQLDMDEVLPAGWREQVETAFRAGNLWPLYKQVTSRNPDGSIRAAFDYFKIHPRKGFIWKYPIHEVVTPIDGAVYARKAIDLEVDHIQDHGKSRNSYLHLLETAVREEPNDWRMHHYLNREYFYKKDWVQVIRTAYECDEIQGGWDIERASTYMWASEACHQLGFKRLAKWWAQEATSAAPEFYEAWHWRAHIAHLYSEWENCLEFASYRLKLSRGVHHLVKPDVWEWWGYDLMALASHRLNQQDDAVLYGKLALAAAPQIERLRINLDFYAAAQMIQSGKEEQQEEKGIEEVRPEISKARSGRSVLWAILAKDAEKLLPFYLECLLMQTYAKKDIYLYIRTNDNKDATASILKDFVEEYGELYMGVHFDDSSISEEIKKYETHEWNSTRFNILGHIRQDSVDFAAEKKFDYYFVSDVDNFLLPQTLESQINLNYEVIAPKLGMVVPEKTEDLVENQNWSNFYFADENYWFKETQEYYEIIEGRKPGVHKVDLVHCTYLLRSDIFSKVNYLVIPNNWEYKNLIISLKNHGVDCYLDARRDYGVLTLSEQVEGAKFQINQLKFLDSNWNAFTETEKAFNSIYAHSKWGYRSGPGSNPENASPYIDYVNFLLGEPSIKNILEIGCGDFRIGRKYHLEGKKYLGIDVNAILINENQKFQTENTKFVNADFVDSSFSGAWDLILIKDVLQHLPNELIRDMVEKICNNSKKAIICNDRATTNVNIAIGGYRGIDLSIDPFNYDFDKVKQYGLKDILLFSRMN